MASLPVIGSIRLDGLDVESAEAAITEACMERELYRNPHVTVTISKKRTNRVMVVGAVANPAIYELPRGNCDLLAVLVAAGGLSKDAGTIVEIRNPSRPDEGEEPPRIAGESGGDGVSTVGLSTISSRNMKSIQVDLVSATRAGAEPFLLKDGGVVYVEKRDPEPVFVQGLVNKPDRYDYPVAEELRLFGAIAMAGGLKNPVADKVYVIRRKPNSTDTVMVDLKISDAKRNDSANLLSAPGDVVTVETTAATVMIDSLRMMNFGMAASLPLTYFFP